MNVKNDISEELRLLSAVVAAISRQPPYEVPEGYFLTLPVQVLRRVNGGHKSLAFNVPEGYFDGFAQQVLNKIKSAGEDPYSSILAEAGRKTPYSVPEGYFEAHSPLLTVARGNNPYTVPAEYFDEQAPLLAIARNNPYTVPAGYFDEQTTAGRLVIAMKGEAAHAPVLREGKVIGIGVRRMNWLKYSAAAVVAGLVLTVGLLRIHTARDKQAAPIDVTIAKTMSTVSDQELQNFLTVRGASFDQPATTASAGNENDLKTLLGNVPDGELKQYMEEHGGADDIATN
jgi:hypothetical protein